MTGGASSTSGGRNSGGAGASTGGASSGGANSGGADEGGAAGSAGEPGNGGAGSDDYLIPNPLISRGKPIESPQQNAAKAFDGDYKADSSWVTAVADGSGAITNSWVKINVGTGFKRLLLVWHHMGTPDYVIAAESNFGAPNAYTIEVSPTGADGTWKQAVSVDTGTSPTYRNRAHSFDFTGMSWVRMTITRMRTTQPGSRGVNLSEIEIFDVSRGMDDTWLFAGGGSARFSYDGHVSPMWPETIHGKHPDYYPAMINLGDLQGTSEFLAAQLDSYLTLNPDFKHWVLTYGLLDAEANVTPAARKFQANMQTVIDKLKAAGKVVLIPRAQAVTDSRHSHLAEYNTIIDQLVKANALPSAPDFYQWFSAHPEQLCMTGCENADQIGSVPTDAGYLAMSTLWAQVLDPLYAP